MNSPQGESMKLVSQVAVVTGASSGIGEATAKALANAEVRVGLAARRSSELQRVAEDIEAKGGHALILPTDLRQQDQISAMLEKTVDAFGRLDILVNNAGVFQWEPISNADIDQWQKEIEVNLLAAMYASRFAVDIMLKQGSGHIVTVSSLAGRYPGPGWPGYSASKAGANHFTTSILYDLMKQDIRVTLIEPGEVDTPMQPDEERGLGKFLHPEDVADAILFAVSRPRHVGVSNIQLIPISK
jgi:NADP-dependent 3-hydroxy acid dehydrogenase YdfG